MGLLNGSDHLPAQSASSPKSVPPLYGHQRPRVEAIRTAFGENAPGFLLVYPTGGGKTGMAVAGLRDLPGERILVITKRDIIPGWRRAIDFFGAGGKQWVVINPERLWRLFEHPSYSLAGLTPDDAAEIAASSDLARCRVTWDAVIVDECQILADPESQRSRLVHRLLHPATGLRPFGLRTSATPFTTLNETAYCADLIAYAARVSEPTDLDDLTGADYRDWLAGLGGDSVETVKELLYRKAVGATASASELGLPAQQRDVRALRLSPQDRELYQQRWEEFQASHGLDDPADPGELGELSEDDEHPLRRVQKASLLKAPYAAEVIAGLVAEGHQVIVPAWFRDNVRALAGHIARRLKARGLDDRVLDITGQDGAGLRERKRQAFQTGLIRVVVLNSHEGINLHAGERDCDGKGTRASMSPRVTVVCDVLTGGKRFLQAEGRGQRDGQKAPALYLYAEGTAEQEWLARTFLRVAATQDLAVVPQDAAALAALADRLITEETAGTSTDRGMR